MTLCSWAAPWLVDRRSRRTGHIRRARAATLAAGAALCQGNGPALMVPRVLLQHHVLQRLKVGHAGGDLTRLAVGEAQLHPRRGLSLVGPALDLCPAQI